MALGILSIDKKGRQQEAVKESVDLVANDLRAAGIKVAKETVVDENIGTSAKKAIEAIIEDICRHRFTQRRRSKIQCRSLGCSCS